MPLPAELSAGHVHGYLLPGPLPSLVDAGIHSPEARSALAAGLDEAGLALAQVKRLVITHAHIDHVGLASEIQAASGCQVLAHPAALPALTDFDRAWHERLDLHRRAARAGDYPPEVIDAFSAGFEARRRFGPQRPIPASALRALPDRARIRLGSATWSVAWLPGHTPDHLGLVHVASGSAIGGDLLLRGAGTIPFLEGRDGAGRRPATLADLIGSWRRLGRMRLAILWPGHGAPIRAHRVLVARRLAEIRGRLSETQSALVDGARSLWEIGCAIGPEPPGPERLQARLGETVALLDWLVERGRARRRLVDGRLIYEPEGPPPSARRRRAAS